MPLSIAAMNDTQSGCDFYDHSVCISGSTSGDPYVYADDLLRTADYKPHAARGSLEKDGDGTAEH